MSKIDPSLYFLGYNVILQFIEAKNMILLQPWLCNLQFNIILKLGNLILYGHVDTMI